MTDTAIGETDRELLEDLANTASRIRAELARAIVGQSDCVEHLLISLFAGGHCLLVGVPGLAKTLMISSIARVLDLEFSRVQFTPDLMPSDITGTEVIQENRESGERTFRFLHGPVFANLVLADEINRAPPKTQAALLEAMQERQVTVAGHCHPMPQPFWVLATQNPIEQEGTYPLPEAQLDRFMLQVFVDYPEADDELDIIMRTTSDEPVELKPQISSTHLQKLMRLVKRISLTENVARYAMEIVRASRPLSEFGKPEPAKSIKIDGTEISELTAWGAGPRGSQNLILAAKAAAAIRGQPMVLPDDIDAVAVNVLRHRIRTNFHAETLGISSAQIVQAIVSKTHLR